ncbi:polysaccharide export protein [Umboniibacter marinipuniceus]|uniref:Polysaccharide export outer membrane protein n=1 Tax=Umboniibacter marinipuniceus TaxID=569599 RepID=A0A3M0A309_9GAMM|nr:polysaccharide export protein [Umboniibacter marinipuniceus]RMA79551.1 polysaccharide export outer membrane protein [Umboniibacter marinipuniceus]
MQSVSIVKLPLALVCAALLSACSIPGSNLKTSDIETVDTGEANLNSQVEILAITPALVQQLKAQQALPAATVNTEMNALIASYDYRIGVADVLNVTVWDHPELTIPAGSYRSAESSGNWVHADGTIFYPYIGQVYVAGKTVSEVRDLIAERLSEYIESPQVDVSISSFRSQKVHVTGEVNVPGRLPVTNVPLTLLEAVNQSGGLAEFADWNDVVLTRQGEEYPVSLQRLMKAGDLSQDYLLQDGDIIHIARNDGAKVFVMGSVAETTVVDINRSDMSLTEALANAGGLDELTADASGVFVMRASDGGDKIAQIYQLDMENAASLILASEFKLQSRDVVYVATEPVAVWNRLIVNLLPTAQTIYYIGRTRDDFIN